MWQLEDWKVFCLSDSGRSDVTPRSLGLRDFFAENEDKSGAKLFITIAKMFGMMKHFLHFRNGCEIPLM